MKKIHSFCFKSKDQTVKLSSYLTFFFFFFFLSFFSSSFFSGFTIAMTSRLTSTFSRNHPAPIPEPSWPIRILQTRPTSRPSILNQPMKMHLFRNKQPDSRNSTWLLKYRVAFSYTTPLTHPKDLSGSSLKVVGSALQLYQFGFSLLTVNLQEDVRICPSGPHVSCHHGNFIIDHCRLEKQ